jgi:YbgC/YbaW family acyl-CoA thioester hydrolase
MGRRHRTPIIVRWGETDPMAIVFYPTYFEWFDHATHRMFASSGRPLIDRLREDGISVPIAECGARFRAPVFADDELVVESSATEIESASFTMEHRIQRDGRIVATGSERRVVARIGEAGRLVVTPMPDDLRGWLAEGEA